MCVSYGYPYAPQLGAETLTEARHVEAVDQRVMHFNGDGHFHAPAVAHALSEHDARNRIAFAWQRIGERREPKPRQNRMKDDVVGRFLRFSQTSLMSGV